MRCLLLAVWAFFGFLPSAVLADILLYPLPGTDLAFVLQGKVTVHPGRTVTFRHPRFGSTLYFRLDDVRYYEVPTTNALASQKLREAVQAGDVETCLQAGRWALHHGLLPEFYEAASTAWKLDPNHPTVKRLVALKRKMDAPLPHAPEQEREMQEYVTSGKAMTFTRSKHFLLLHDVPLATGDKEKKSRAAERLELLETVYEGFLLKFCLEGFELDVPREQLKVVLFADRQDYLTFSDELKPVLSKSAGFYDRKDEIAVFFDQGTNEIYRALDRLNRELQTLKESAMKKRSEGAAETRRLADTIQLLTQKAQENADIEVVSHESTHHLAAVTGLMPNDAPVPVWAAEGLATYFECPKEAAWSGVGAVNKERLDWYRELASDRKHSNIDFIVSDRIFMNAAGDEAIAHAYGQSWALTHFLMERHFDKLVEYYLSMADKRSDKQPSAEENQETFQRVFGPLKSKLDVEWRDYMRSLKTDVELVLEGK